MPDFTVPASNHNPGDPNFVPDINSEYAATAQLAAGNVLDTAYSGGADPGGSSDSTAAISAALSAAGIAVLPPGGTYKVANLVMPANSILWAYGATILQAAAGATITPASSCRIIGARGYGGSATTSSNPAADFIAAASGATNWAVADVGCDNVNGWILNPAVSGSFHAFLRGIRGNACAGGVQLTQGTGATTVAGEVNMSDVNIQGCTANPALSVMGLTDVIGSMLNLSADGSLNSGPTVLLQGKCGGYLAGIDWGVINGGVTGVPVLSVADAGGGSPSNWDLSGGSVQQGGIGVQVAGGAARMRFRGILSQQNLGDGWRFTGTGTALLVSDCMGNSNNSAAGTAYDVNVTSTAHVGLFEFAYCSTGVTNSLIVPATNHVSNVNPTSPGGVAVSGTPSGW